MKRPRPLFVGLLVGALAGIPAGGFAAYAGVAWMVTVANANSDVNRLGAYALGKHLEACRLSKQPRRWPPEEE